MENTVILEIFDFLKTKGIARTESEFSEDWLGCSEGYMRKLRSTGSEPSMGAIAVCGSRLQKAGREMASSARYQQIGMSFLALSEKCHEQVNRNAIEFDIRN